MIRMSVVLVVMLCARCLSEGEQSDMPLNTPPDASGVQPSTLLISRNNDGILGNDHSRNPSISSDGRYIVFGSNADNLVADDVNGSRDIFVYDRDTASIVRIADPANGHSLNASISGDGRYIVFEFFEDDRQDRIISRHNVFVYDQKRDELTQIDIDHEEPRPDYTYVGNTTPAISADGQYVVFFSFYQRLFPLSHYGDVVVYGRLTGETQRIRIGENGEGFFRQRGHETHPAISLDGRYVAFESPDPDLVEGDTNFLRDIFVYDGETREIERVSVDSDGNQTIGFRNCITGSSCTGGMTSIEGHSRRPISADGHFVVFESQAKNLVGDPGVCDGDCFQCAHCLRAEIFLHDRQSGETTLIAGEANHSNLAPVISADGRYVAFESLVDNLREDDVNELRDVFVYDRETGEIESVSFGGMGSLSIFLLGSTSPAISRDGRFVVFTSDTIDFFPDDTNERRDVFLRDRGEFP